MQPSSLVGSANAWYCTSGPAVGNLANATSNLVYANVGSVYSEPFGVTDGSGSASCASNGTWDADIHTIHNEGDLTRLTITTT
jgi:hypothetical protein